MVSVLGFLGYVQPRLRAAYQEDVQRRLRPVTPGELILASDLEPLPEPVQHYLRRAGVVGHPRVRNFRVRMHGRFRNGAQARWMPFTAEQYNFVDEPARLFYMRVSMFGVPVHGYHRYVGPSATMDIRVAGLVPIVYAAGDEMNQSETVTLFNDMCFMAPATLVDPGIEWDRVGGNTVGAVFRNAGHVVRAELTFNESGELTNFWSDDRYQLSPDGRSARKLRWSTPLAGYRSFGPFRLASGGNARWHEPRGEYAYIELALDDVVYNVAR